MTSLEQILAHQHIWQANQSATAIPSGVPSGYPELDAVLPGGGWPQGALTEILHDRPGIGELRLITPLLSRLSTEPAWQLWINPPWQPYAPALAQAGIKLENQLLVTGGLPQDFIWAFEQGLRSGACSLVLGWLPRLKASELRRLQLAAAASRAVAILFRPSEQAQQSSPAALRIALERLKNGQTGLTIVKRRGGWPIPQQQLSLPSPF